MFIVGHVPVDMYRYVPVIIVRTVHQLLLMKKKMGYSTVKIVWMRYYLVRIKMLIVFVNFSGLTEFNLKNIFDCI